MNHKALDKAKDKRRYLRNWLRRDVEQYQERRGQAMKGSGGYASALPYDPNTDGVVEYEEQRWQETLARAEREKRAEEEAMKTAKEVVDDF